MRRINREATRHSATAKNSAGVSALAVISMLCASGVQAAEIDTGTDLQLRWDNTVKYSTGVRVGNPNAGVSDNPGTPYSLNGNDGDRAFKKWNVMSNRGDLLSEFNASYKDFGFRVSGAAWYDDVYNNHHASDPANQVNASSVGSDTFTHATQVQQGKNAELQDAFVFGKGDAGDTTVRFRAGRHTLLWGESLFLASNGIAYGQAPIDVAKAVGVPNTQAKEVFMPVGQLSVQIQPSDNLTLEGYWQPEWRPSRLPAAGSYFSTADFLGAGAERILAKGYNASGATNFLYFSHHKDIKPDGLADQMGVAAKFRVPKIDTDFGLYALMYDDKEAQVYAHTANFGVGQPGDYQEVYAKNIRMYGASASTNLGEWNVGGEVSYRQNTPFISGDRGLMAGVPVDADAGNKRQYATGDSFHAQMSGILLLGPTSLWQGGSIVGEVGGHRRISVDENRGMLDTKRSHQVVGVRTVFEPSYYQVAPGIDMSVPIGVGYTIGQSPIDVGFNNGAPDRGGDASIGVKADYEKLWFGSLNYTHYVGRDDQQMLLGRDFVSLSVQRTF